MMADYTFPSHEHAGAHDDDGICHTWKEKKEEWAQRPKHKEGRTPWPWGGGKPPLLDLQVVLIAARSVRDLNFAADDKPEDDCWGLCEIPDVLGRTCGFSANYKAHRLL